MSRIIAQHNPIAFKTQAIQVKASSEVLHYTPVGLPLSFAAMQDRRQPIDLADPEHFEVTLANLGVSVALELTWRGRRFQLLIKEPDSAQLKLISGYVPAHELRVPLLTAMNEIAEELLLETESGWLQGRYQDTWLPTPYADTLPLDPRRHYCLAPQRGASRAVMCRELNLLERPRAYVHLPTNSLQLIYYLSLQLPDNLEHISGLHADERLDTASGQLITQLDYQNADLYLAEFAAQAPTGQLFQLSRGELIEQSGHVFTLGEAMAEQEGWVVRERKTDWPDGLHNL
ncbi:hypothetical protein [Halopseudomonas salegens]|uniref:Metal ABC transporter ATPase n=1 Tax=Halopseudomonas salegens TaxID=1434072 RepID=A0A1H2EJV3_9GAMM|nr:hypothetical protein [Halopseudomonas salegens]SDT95462.1 hypothetical protein SAMN05216210_0799 [Halopseudomonas salegens]